MIESILKSFEVWTDAQGTKSKGRVKSIDNISFEGISRFRELILELAIRGKLVLQDPNDEPAAELLKKIDEEKKLLIIEGKIKSQEPQSKIDISEIPFDLPPSWGFERFGNLLIEAYTGLDKSKSLQSSNFKYPYFKMNNILNNGGFDLTDISRIDATRDEIEKFHLNNGDFLFNTRNSRELVGKTCVIRGLSNETILYNNNILRAKLLHILPEFIDFWFRSSTGKGLLEKIKSNTTNVCAIYQGKLFELCCVIPPYEEQKRIVAKVKEILALCDKLEEEKTGNLTTHHDLVSSLLKTLANAPNLDELQTLWDKISEQFETLFCTEESIDQLKEVLLQLVIRGQFGTQNENDIPANEVLKNIEEELTDKFGKEYSEKLERDKSTFDPTEFHVPIPDSWVWCELQDVALLFNGKAHEQFVDDNGKFILVNSSFVSSEGKVFKTVSTQLTPLSKGEIAIVMSDVPGGKALVKCFLVKEDNKYSLNQRIGGISASSFIDINFLKLVINRNKYYLQYDDGKKQTNLKKIQILSCPIPLPPFEEQQRIVAKVAELFGLCDSLKSRIEKANEINLSLSQTVLDFI